MDISMVIRKLKEETGEDNIAPMTRTVNNGTEIRCIRVIKKDSPECGMLFRIPETVPDIDDYINDVANAIMFGKQPDGLIEKFNREYVMENCFIELVNAKFNDIEPYQMFLDLKQVVRVDFEDYTMLLNRKMIKTIGLSEEELFEQARRNSPRILNYTLKGISEMVIGTPRPDEFMYVLSSDYGKFGATALIDSGFLKSVSADIGDDLIIIPSSVHELIAVPAQHASLQAYKMILREVNLTSVKEEELLSYTIYGYSRADGSISILA